MRVLNYLYHNQVHVTNKSIRLVGQIRTDEEALLANYGLSRKSRSRDDQASGNVPRPDTVLRLPIINKPVTIPKLGFGQFLAAKKKSSLAPACCFLTANYAVTDQRNVT